MKNLYVMADTMKEKRLKVLGVVGIDTPVGKFNDPLSIQSRVSMSKQTVCDKNDLKHKSTYVSFKKPEPRKYLSSVIPRSPL